MDSLNEGLILFCCIVDFGKGSKLFKISNDIGGVNSTIYLGRGTIKNEFLNILGIVETRKEIFNVIIDESMEELYYDRVLDVLDLEKHHHGIAFSMPVKYCSTIDDSKTITNPKKEGVFALDYEAIYIILNKGKLDDVLEATERAGSTGGTIIHGRGSGSKEKETLFNITIEPEKEIILILSRAHKTQAIIDSIKETLNVEDPGQGIIFVMDVSKAVGLYEND